MTDPAPPDSLSDLDLALLLLSQERERRVAVQVELLAHQLANARREQEQLQRAGHELQAVLCARYALGPTDAIDARTGAIARKSASND